MQLTLVRHGEAAPPVMGNDEKRPLTARGQTQAAETRSIFERYNSTRRFCGESVTACAANTFIFAKTFSTCACGYL